MTPDETALVLAKAALIDMRTIGEEDVMAWHEILHRLDYADARTAVSAHYSESRERLMPADVIRHARTARDARQRQEKAGRSEPLALPSRFETDEMRDLRVKQGLAQCKEVLQPVMDMLAARRRLRDEAG